jgi:hypothetical protein
LADGLKAKPASSIPAQWETIMTKVSSRAELSICWPAPDVPCAYNDLWIYAVTRCPIPPANFGVSAAAAGFTGDEAIKEHQYCGGADRHQIMQIGSHTRQNPRQG